MKDDWQLQDAKNRFSEVVDLALTQGPQSITRHGKKTAVLLSYHDFQKLKRRQGSLADFFHASPLGELDLGRPREFPRSVAL